MADENTGLDLASQTGQENIVEAIHGLKIALSSIIGIQGPNGLSDGTYILTVSSGTPSWLAVVDGDGGSY